MNRRNFIGSLLALGAGFTILPGTGRVWRAEKKLVLPDFDPKYLITPPTLYDFLMTHTEIGVRNGSLEIIQSSEHTFHVMDVPAIQTPTQEELRKLFFP